MQRVTDYLVAFGTASQELPSPPWPLPCTTSDYHVEPVIHVWRDPLLIEIDIGWLDAPLTPLRSRTYLYMHIMAGGTFLTTAF
jgi:hypothetical protein